MILHIDSPTNSTPKKQLLELINEISEHAGTKSIYKNLLFLYISNKLSESEIK